MELKDVVIKAQNGDVKAFTALFEETQKMVYFNALKITGSETVAEDVVQDVYMKALEKLPSLKVPEAFIGWLRQITVNTCKDYLTANNSSALGADEADEELAKLPMLDEDFLPETYADNKETCRIIMRIVDSLPEAQRIAVILYYYNELPVARIAEVLQISENTVKSRLNYARRQIKEQVEDLEKKGTKLHAVPVLGLILQRAAEDYSLSSAASATIVTSVTASAAGTTAAVGGGILAKIAALPLVTKVIGGALAAAIAVGAGFGISNAVKNDEPSNDITNNMVTVDSDTAKAFATVEIENFIDMPIEEVIACFGEDYTKESYSSGEEYISYTFNYGKEYDYLIFQYAPDNDGRDIVTSVQILGNVVNCMGLNLSKTPDEAREILEENGFELSHSSDDEYDFEVYTNPSANYQVSFMYQGDDIVNVSLDSFYSYHDGGEGLAKKYDAIITSGDFVIATKGNEATIAAYTGSAVNLLVPAEIDGYKVVAIDEVWDTETNAQYNGLAYSDFESVTLSEGIERIGAYSFKHCGDMKSIDLPNSLKEIGHSAFAWCEKLESITIPSGVSTIESSTFWDCENLTEVNLPNSLESIGSSAFNHCGFKSISIPESVTFIDKNAFAECYKLESVTLPSKIIEISEGLFSECDSLTYVGIPSGVTSIGDGAFFECYSLESITLPSKLENIGVGAFGKCSKLNDLVIPSGVKTIGANAFCYCEELEKLTIPKGVTNIGYHSPFAGCYELTLELEMGGNFRLDDQGALYTKDTKELIYVPYNTEEFKIPNSVTKIRAGAFAECDSIESVVIPSGVTEIGENAFLWCDGLKSVDVPSSVKVIGAEAFTVGYGFEGIKCREGSYAESYAKENNVAYELVK